MSIRRKRPPDSLYMLLDTMCNAFGGIILLAVLVTLLTSTEKQTQGKNASDSQEMLQRRLALAETNLQESSQLLHSLQAKAQDDRWKKQVALLDTRKKLQIALQETRDVVTQNNKELDTASASDPSERVKFLNAQLAAAQARQLDVQNRFNAATENTRRLKQRLEALDSQIINKYNQSIRSLRLPKEYQTGKRVMYVIVEYGEIYPCHNADMSRNETSINWTSGFLSESAQPVPGKGINPVTNAGALESYFRSQSKEDIYIVFCVFEDSFPAFIAAKQSAATSGLAFGWEPSRNEEGPIRFGANGHVPKPQ